MNKQDLIKSASYLVDNSEDNIISKDIAISASIVGMKMYEAPIFAFGAAGDETFTLLKEASAIGKHFLLPTEWLPNAKTVISFFLPMTEAVKESNCQDMSWPSEAWLHARVEGQTFINKLCQHLNSELIHAGYDSLVPSLDERFCFSFNDTSDYSTNSKVPKPFSSNWSERHAAFVCGLGTFGLSANLITKRGAAGRFGSIITELYLPPDKREYEAIYEYCIMCGKCAKNCPVHAISTDKGKDHNLCFSFFDRVPLLEGCGKCQVSVPCENGIPLQASRKII